MAGHIGVAGVGIEDCGVIGIVQVHERIPILRLICGEAVDKRELRKPHGFAVRERAVDDNGVFERVEVVGQRFAVGVEHIPRVIDMPSVLDDAAKQVANGRKAPIHVTRLERPDGPAKAAGLEDSAEGDRVAIALIFDRQVQRAKVHGLAARHVGPLAF